MSRQEWFNELKRLVDEKFKHTDDYYYWCYWDDYRLAKLTPSEAIEEYCDCAEG